MPKAIQKKAKADLQEIWMAESRKLADKAFDLYLEKYGDKYYQATDYLKKDRQQLLTFYDFPAAHWKHIRTSNPIESTFASVRHRTIKTQGCLSHETALTMVFKLVMAASRKWQRLNGRNELQKLIEGVRFADGMEVKKDDKQSAA